MIATISNEVATGRSMKIRDGFMSRSGLLVGLGGSAGASAVAVAVTTTVSRASPLLTRRLGGVGRCDGAGRWGGVGRRGRDRRAGRRARVGARPADLGAVAQPIRAVDDDLVADLQAARDLHLLAVGHAQRDDLDRDGVVGLDEIDVGTG